MLHTPELSNYHYDKIVNLTGIYFEDISYIHDLADSIGFGIYLQIFLPNSANDDADEEQFNTFHVEFDDQQGVTFSDTFDTVEDLCKFLQSCNGKHIVEIALRSLREENRKQLREEKSMVLGKFQQIFVDCMDDTNILTHDMLKRIKDTAENLLLNDF